LTYTYRRRETRRVRERDSSFLDKRKNIYLVSLLRRKNIMVCAFSEEKRPDRGEREREGRKKKSEK
jgi:hypothetical protein